MAGFYYSGSWGNSYQLNRTRTCNLTGYGTAEGIVNSVEVELTFSTNAYSKYYDIEVTLNYSGGSVTEYDTIKMDSSNYSSYQHSFTFYGLTPEQVNSIYSVSAIATDDNSDKVYVKSSVSAYVDYTVPSILSAPTASVSATKTTASTVTLSWSGVANATANSVTGYEIMYRDSSDGSSWESWTGYDEGFYSSGTRSATLDLPSARNYRQFRIRARGSAGYDYFSNWTECSAVLRAATPTTPGSMAATPATWESGNVSLSWAASTATGATISRYYVEYRLKPYGGSYGAWTALANTTALKYEYNPNLTKGSSIQYRVRALSSDSAYSAYSSVKTVSCETEKATDLTPVSGWYVSLTTCSWTPPAGSSYCKYRYSTNGGSTWSAYVTLSAGVNSFDVSSIFAGMSIGAAFRFGVVGVASNGDTTDEAYSDLLYKNGAPPVPVRVLPTSENFSSYGLAYIVLSVAPDPNGHELRLEYKIDSGNWTATACHTGNVHIAIKLARTCTIRFRTTDEHGAASAELVMSMTLLDETFTDDPLIAGTTRIKAIHMNELREQISTLCALYGAAIPQWAESIVAGTTSIRGFADHIAEMREAVDAAYSAFNGTPYQDIVVSPVWAAEIVDCQPKADAINEIRRAIEKI